MDNLLLKYMNDRIRPEIKKIAEPGPVITISRECGCSGRVFAEKLTERINHEISAPDKKWKWVNKEILSLASEELKIRPDHIRDFLKAEDTNFIEDIVSAFTLKYYGHDARIRRVIKDVVRHIAVRGKVIIVGRGSEALTRDIPRSLHIKLFAPLSWKAEVISKRNSISLKEAEKYVLKTDKRRSEFVEAYLVKNQDKVVYDLDLNCARFNQEEIIELIMKAIETKSLF